MLCGIYIISYDTGKIYCKTLALQSGMYGLNFEKLIVRQLMLRHAEMICALEENFVKSL